MNGVHLSGYSEVSQTKRSCGALAANGVKTVRRREVCTPPGTRRLLRRRVASQPLSLLRNSSTSWREQRERQCMCAARARGEIQCEKREERGVKCTFELNVRLVK